MTISDLRKALIKQITPIFQPNETLSITRLILDHCGFDEQTILHNPEADADEKILPEINKIVSELNKNRPIQYILGETQFYDLTFLVNEDVLIPRPETEELVSNILQENVQPDPAVIDIGTGSGCIAVTLAKNIPGAKVLASDIDKRALKITRENASKNRVSINSAILDILEFSKHGIQGPFDLIVSNPPYVTEEEKLMMMPNVLDFEPSTALFVPDNDPLVYYKAIIKFAESTLSKEGVVWVEINEKFGKETSSLFENAGYHKIRLLKDIHGKDRFIKAQK